MPQTIRRKKYYPKAPVKKLRQREVGEVYFSWRHKCFCKVYDVHGGCCIYCVYHLKDSCSGNECGECRAPLRKDKKAVKFIKSTFRQWLRYKLGLNHGKKE